MAMVEISKSDFASFIGLIVISIFSSYTFVKAGQYFPVLKPQFRTV
jgi:hypothetical protein